MTESTHGPEYQMKVELDESDVREVGQKAAKSLEQTLEKATDAALRKTQQQIKAKFDARTGTFTSAAKKASGISVNPQVDVTMPLTWQRPAANTFTGGTDSPLNFPNIFPRGRTANSGNPLGFSLGKGDSLLGAINRLRGSSGAPIAPSGASVSNAFRFGPPPLPPGHGPLTGTTNGGSIAGINAWGSPVPPPIPGKTPLQIGQAPTQSGTSLPGFAPPQTQTQKPPSVNAQGGTAPSWMQGFAALGAAMTTLSSSLLQWVKSGAKSAGNVMGGKFSASRLLEAVGQMGGASGSAANYLQMGKSIGGKMGGAVAIGSAIANTTQQQQFYAPVSEYFGNKMYRAGQSFFGTTGNQAKVFDAHFNAREQNKFNREALQFYLSKTDRTTGQWGGGYNSSGKFDGMSPKDIENVFGYGYGDPGVAAKAKKKGLDPAFGKIPSFYVNNDQFKAAFAGAAGGTGFFSQYGTKSGPMKDEKEIAKHKIGLGQLSGSFFATRLEEDEGARNMYRAGVGNVAGKVASAEAARRDKAAAGTKESKPHPENIRLMQTRLASRMNEMLGTMVASAEESFGKSKRLRFRINTGWTTANQ